MNHDLHDISSPCRNICTLNTTKTICIGCGRTLDEIAEWSRANDNRKQEILASANTRRQQHENSMSQD